MANESKNPIGEREKGDRHRPSLHGENKSPARKWRQSMGKKREETCAAQGHRSKRGEDTHQGMIGKNFSLNHC